MRFLPRPQPISVMGVSAGQFLVGYRRTNLPWCHFLNETDWLAVTEDWDARV